MPEAPTTITFEGIVTTLTNTVSTLLKVKGAIAVILVIAVVAFALGYLSGRPLVYRDSPPAFATTSPFAKQ
ncbi:MAG: hypothetical protein ACM3UN_03385 [Bacillota bacterium]